MELRRGNYEKKKKNENFKVTIFGAASVKKSPKWQLPLQCWDADPVSVTLIFQVICFTRHDKMVFVWLPAYMLLCTIGHKHCYLQNVVFLLNFCGRLTLAQWNAYIYIYIYTTDKQFAWRMWDSKYIRTYVHAYTYERTYTYIHIHIHVYIYVYSHALEKC